MISAKRILVAVRREPDAAQVLNKVALLCHGSDSHVQVIRVVHDDMVTSRHTAEGEGQKLKTLILQAEEEYLEGLIEPYRSRFAAIESATVWHRRPFAGVLDVARDIGADLIVKGAEVGARIAEIVRTPDDWHLLREASCPVMLVKLAAWLDAPRIIAAVDALDDEHAVLNRRVLDVAREMAQRLGGSVDLVSTYPAYQPWAAEMSAAYDYVKMRRSIEHEIEQKQRALLGGGPGAEHIGVHLHAIEGEPAHAINQLAEELGAEMIVLGTAARAGIAALVIGNTSEALLHLTQRDVLVVRQQ